MLTRRVAEARTQSKYLMDQNHYVCMVPATSSRAELLQAHAELWRRTFGYFESMALRCAVKLGIPNAIHRCGGTASLPELLAAIPLPANKQPYLLRLMRFLTASGIFVTDEAPITVGEGGTEVAAGGIYRLTPVSRLLVDDAGARGCASMSPLVLSQTTLFHFTAAVHLAEWFKDEEATAAAETPFKAAYGTELWGVMARDAEFNAVFNDGLGSDSRFLLGLLVGGECREVFEGISSLVDVGGGIGTAARAIATAFPDIKCSVLDLPQVVDDIPAGGIVEFVEGDMMDFIPPADAVLLKFVLHDWSDEECVKILRRCRNAIPSQGKVLIVESVFGSSPSRVMHQAQLLLDLGMMVLTKGKEREEHEWHKMFVDAGFSHYKVKPVLGVLSIIEVYP